MVLEKTFCSAFDVEISLVKRCVWCRDEFNTKYGFCSIANAGVMMSDWHANLNTNIAYYSLDVSLDFNLSPFPEESIPSYKSRLLRLVSWKFQDLRTKLVHVMMFMQNTYTLDICQTWAKIIIRSPTWRMHLGILYDQEKFFCLGKCHTRSEV